MNVSQVKQASPRVEFPPFSNLEIIGYGIDNLYPQRITEVIACSETGEGCLKRYIDFIQGNGFKDVAFSEIVINSKGDTADDIQQQVADDLGRYNGFALHVNYNMLGDIVEISHIPFENCRLGEEDESGYIGFIAVFTDWSGRKKRKNKILKPEKDKIDYIHVFNPRKEVIFKQIEACGGIENYKGQILWISGSGRQEYPKAIYDKVITQMSNEEGLGNIALRNTRNNFLPAGMLITKKGQDPSDDETDDDIDYEDNSIADAVSKVQGDLHTNKILHFKVEFDEEEPKFVAFQGTNYDKDFTVTSDTVCEKIYAAFGQEAWHRIRKGSVGFSSDIMRDTYDVYNSVTNGERRMIERAFDKIFKYWYKPINTTDFSIQPLKYISSETKTINEDKYSIYTDNKAVLNKKNSSKFMSMINAVLNRN